MADAPNQADVDRLLAQAEAQAPIEQRLPPREWMKKNLFSNGFSTVLSVVAGAVVFFVLFQAVRWVFNTDFEIVRANLRLFMIGQFPRDELWRPVASLLLVVAAVGLVSGGLAHNAYDDAIEKGLPAERPTWLQLIRRFWAIIAVIIFFVSFARTGTPFLWIGITFLTAVVTRETGWRVSESVRSRIVFIGSVLGIGSMVVLAGTGGLGKLAFAVIALIWAGSEVGRRDLDRNVTGYATRYGVPIVVAGVVYVVVGLIGFEGFGWDDWGGLHLTLFVTVIGIGLGMPLGILLALGRKSELPVIKAASVMFIEFVRGVPLISLLLFSNLMLLLFFPRGANIPSELTRAMIVITGFSAAYIAEIVRGGLQSVPKGQIEAAQASRVVSRCGPAPHRFASGPPQCDSGDGWPVHSTVQRHVVVGDHQSVGFLAYLRTLPTSSRRFWGRA